MSVTAVDLLSIPDEEVLLQRLWRELSPDGNTAHCPKCECPRIFKRYQMTPPRRSWTCTACGHHLHPTAGTPFEKISFDKARWMAERALSEAPVVPNQCAGHVDLGNGFVAKKYPPVRCSRRGTLEHEGRWYCRTHAPTIPVVTEEVYEDAVDLCGCGCGETVNPWLAVFRTWVDDGATHAEVAELLGFSRAYVSLLLRRPPKFVKGHGARVFWGSAKGRHLRSIGEAKRHVAATERKRQRLERDADRKEKQDWGLLVRQRNVVSLDVIGHAEGDEISGHNRIRDHSLDPLRQLLNEKLWEIVGDMRPEDVARMDEHSLSRLQARLLAEGFSTPRVTESERKRLRDPEVHSGGGIAKSKSRGGKATRRQRLEHTAAKQANRGGKHRPKQKQPKRWSRETLSPRSGTAS